jgi:hypothetical protein
LGIERKPTLLQDLKEHTPFHAREEKGFQRAPEVLLGPIGGFPLVHQIEGLAVCNVPLPRFLDADGQLDCDFHMFRHGILSIMAVDPLMKGISASRQASQGPRHRLGGRGRWREIGLWNFHHKATESTENGPVLFNGR